jgi:hypothetical protein
MLLLSPAGNGQVNKRSPNTTRTRRDTRPQCAEMPLPGIAVLFTVAVTAAMMMMQGGAAAEEPAATAQPKAWSRKMPKRRKGKFRQLKHSDRGTRRGIIAQPPDQARPYTWDPQDHNTRD